MEEIEKEPLETVDELPEGSENEQIDWEAEAKKFQGIAKRNSTRATKYKTLYDDAKKNLPAQNTDSSHKQDNYAELSYLAVKGIESDEEISLVREAMQDTGKSMREVVTSKWFTAQLKEMREAKTTKDAIPSGSKRSSSSAKDTVDYWISKGEMPPNTPENRKLREEIVETRLKRAKQDVFTSHPIV